MYIIIFFRRNLSKELKKLLSGSRLYKAVVSVAVELVEELPLGSTAVAIWLLTVAYVLPMISVAIFYGQFF